MHTIAVTSPPLSSLTVGAAWIGVLACGVCVSALLAVHLAPTGLSPLEHAVSEYGIGRWRWLYRVQTLAMAFAALALAVALGALPGRPVAAWGLAGLTLAAASRAVISWFPMDVPGQALTRTGRRHGLLALVAFVGLALCAHPVARGLAVVGVPHEVATSGGWLMGLSLGAMVVMRLSGTRRLFGLVERAFYVGAVTFLAGVAFALALH